MLQGTGSKLGARRKTFAEPAFVSPVARHCNMAPVGKKHCKNTRLMRLTLRFASPSRRTSSFQVRKYKNRFFFLCVFCFSMGHRVRDCVWGMSMKICSCVVVMFKTVYILHAGLGYN